jgi:hypothetical protein
MLTAMQMPQDQELVSAIRGRGFPFIEIDFLPPSQYQARGEWIVRARASRLPRADMYATDGSTLVEALGSALDGINERWQGKPFDGEINYAWWRYPQWLLCRLHLIHNPHCHAYSGYGWVFKEAASQRKARESGRCMGVGCFPMYYWKPQDWIHWLFFDCNRCDHSDCLNYGDC